MPYGRGDHVELLRRLKVTPCSALHPQPCAAASIAYETILSKHVWAPTCPPLLVSCKSRARILRASSPSTCAEVKGTWCAGQVAGAWDQEGDLGLGELQASSDGAARVSQAPPAGWVAHLSSGSMMMDFEGAEAIAARMGNRCAALCSALLACCLRGISIYREW